VILLVDVGNTRLKWAWLTSTGLSDQQAIVYRDAKPGIWTTAMFESGQKATRVLVSNVAGAAMAKTLQRLARKQFGVSVELITATPEFQGLVNGYLDPSLLGADRWLALIGGPRLGPHYASSMPARPSKSIAWTPTAITSAG